MNNDTVETARAIFRWEPRSKSVIVTVGTVQFELTSGDAMNLLEMLHAHKAELFRSANDLPDWLQDDEPQPGPRPLPAPTVDPAGTNVWLDERRY